jgi:hypothetical protein
MRRLGLIHAGLLAGLVVPAAVLAHGGVDLQQQCGACHALTPPDVAADATERAQRKAPPLYYAGNKFQRDWLVRWLQNPTVVRPAGVFPAALAKPGDKGDFVDPSALPKHPAVPQAQAEATVDHLMQLRPFDKLVQAEKYTPGTIALRLGQMNFGKFKGCDGCHQDAPGKGGVSGPELYTAWQRLQPAFISSYIADPVAWDPHSMMPKGDSNSDAVHKLADYLKAIGEKK